MATDPALTVLPYEPDDDFAARGLSVSPGLAQAIGQSAYRTTQRNQAQSSPLAITAARLRDADIRGLPNQEAQDLVQMRRDALEAAQTTEAGLPRGFTGKFAEAWERGSFRDAAHKLADRIRKLDPDMREEALGQWGQLMEVYEAASAQDPLNADWKIQQWALEGAESLQPMIKAMGRQVLYGLGEAALYFGLGALEPTPVAEAIGVTKIAGRIGRMRRLLTSWKATRAATSAGRAGASLGLRTATRAGRFYVASKPWIDQAQGQIYTRLRAEGRSHEVSDSLADWTGAIHGAVETILSPLGMVNDAFGVNRNVSKFFISRVLGSATNTVWKRFSARLAGLGASRVAAFAAEASEEYIQGGIEEYASIAGRLEEEFRAEVLDEFRNQIIDHAGDDDVSAYVARQVSAVLDNWGQIEDAAIDQGNRAAGAVAFLTMLGLPINMATNIAQDIGTSLDERGLRKAGELPDSGNVPSAGQISQFTDNNEAAYRNGLQAWAGRGRQRNAAKAEQRAQDATDAQAVEAAAKQVELVEATQTARNTVDLFMASAAEEEKRLAPGVPDAEDAGVRAAQKDLTKAEEGAWKARRDELLVEYTTHRDAYIKALVDQGMSESEAKKQAETDGYVKKPKSFIVTIEDHKVAVDAAARAVVIAQDNADAARTIRVENARRILAIWAQHTQGMVEEPSDVQWIDGETGKWVKLTKAEQLRQERVLVKEGILAEVDVVADRYKSMVRDEPPAGMADDVVPVWRKLMATKITIENELKTLGYNADDASAGSDVAVVNMGMKRRKIAILVEALADTNKKLAAINMQAATTVARSMDAPVTNRETNEEALLTFTREGTAGENLVNSKPPQTLEEDGKVYAVSENDEEAVEYDADAFFTKYDMGVPPVAAKAKIDQQVAAGAQPSAPPQAARTQAAQQAEKGEGAPAEPTSEEADAEAGEEPVTSRGGTITETEADGKTVFRFSAEGSPTSYEMSKDLPPRVAGRDVVRTADGSLWRVVGVVNFRGIPTHYNYILQDAASVLDPNLKERELFRTGPMAPTHRSFIVVGENETAAQVMEAVDQAALGSQPATEGAGESDQHMLKFQEEVQGILKALDAALKAKRLGPFLPNKKGGEVRLKGQPLVERNKLIDDANRAVASARLKAESNRKRDSGEQEVITSWRRLAFRHQDNAVVPTPADEGGADPMNAKFIQEQHIKKLSAALGWGTSRQVESVLEAEQALMNLKQQRTALNARMRTFVGGAVQGDGEVTPAQREQFNRLSDERAALNEKIRVGTDDFMERLTVIYRRLPRNNIVGKRVKAINRLLFDHGTLSHMLAKYADVRKRAKAVKDNAPGDTEQQKALQGKLEAIEAETKKARKIATAYVYSGRTAEGVVSPRIIKSLMGITDQVLPILSPVERAAVDKDVTALLDALIDATPGAEGDAAFVKAATSLINLAGQMVTTTDAGGALHAEVVANILRRLESLRVSVVGVRMGIDIAAGAAEGAVLEASRKRAKQKKGKLSGMQPWQVQVLSGLERGGNTAKLQQAVAAQMTGQDDVVAKLDSMMDELAVERDAIRGQIDDQLEGAPDADAIRAEAALISNRIGRKPTKRFDDNVKTANDLDLFEIDITRVIALRDDSFAALKGALARIHPKLEVPSIPVTQRGNTTSTPEDNSKLASLQRADWAAKLTKRISELTNVATAEDGTPLATPQEFEAARRTAVLAIENIVALDLGVGETTMLDTRANWKARGDALRAAGRKVDVRAYVYDQHIERGAEHSLRLALREMLKAVKGTRAGGTANIKALSPNEAQKAVQDATPIPAATNAVAPKERQRLMDVRRAVSKTVVRALNEIYSIGTISLDDFVQNLSAEDAADVEEAGGEIEDEATTPSTADLTPVQIAAMKAQAAELTGADTPLSGDDLQRDTAADDPTTALDEGDPDAVEAAGIQRPKGKVDPARAALRSARENVRILDTLNTTLEREQSRLERQDTQVETASNRYTQAQHDANQSAQVATIAEEGDTQNAKSRRTKANADAARAANNLVRMQEAEAEAEETRRVIGVTKEHIDDFATDVYFDTDPRGVNQKEVFLAWQRIKWPNEEQPVERGALAVQRLTQFKQEWAAHRKKFLVHDRRTAEGRKAYQRERTQHYTAARKTVNEKLKVYKDALKAAVNSKAVPVATSKTDDFNRLVEWAKDTFARDRLSARLGVLVDGVKSMAGASVALKNLSKTESDDLRTELALRAKFWDGDKDLARGHELLLSDGTTMTMGQIIAEIIAVHQQLGMRVPESWVKNQWISNASSGSSNALDSSGNQVVSNARQVKMPDTLGSIEAPPLRLHGITGDRAERLNTTLGSSLPEMVGVLKDRAFVNAAIEWAEAERAQVSGEAVGDAVANKLGPASSLTQRIMAMGIVPNVKLEATTAAGRTAELAKFDLRRNRAIQREQLSRTTPESRAADAAFADLKQAVRDSVVSKRMLESAINTKAGLFPLENLSSAADLDASLEKQQALRRDITREEAALESSLNVLPNLDNPRSPITAAATGQALTVGRQEAARLRTVTARENLAALETELADEQAQSRELRSGQYTRRVTDPNAKRAITALPEPVPAVDAELRKLEKDPSSTEMGVSRNALALFANAKGLAEGTRDATRLQRVEGAVGDPVANQQEAQDLINDALDRIGIKGRVNLNQKDNNLLESYEGITTIRVVRDTSDPSVAGSFTPQAGVFEIRFNPDTMTVTTAAHETVRHMAVASLTDTALNVLAKDLGVTTGDRVATEEAVVQALDGISEGTLSPRARSIWHFLKRLIQAAARLIGLDPNDPTNLRKRIESGETAQEAIATGLNQENPTLGVTRLQKKGTRLGRRHAATTPSPIRDALADEVANAKVPVRGSADATLGGRLRAAVRGWAETTSTLLAGIGPKTERLVQEIGNQGDTRESRLRTDIEALYADDRGAKVINAAKLNSKERLTDGKGRAVRGSRVRNRVYLGGIGRMIQPLVAAEVADGIRGVRAYINAQPSEQKLDLRKMAWAYMHIDVSATGKRLAEDGSKQGDSNYQVKYVSHNNVDHSWSARQLVAISAGLTQAERDVIDWGNRVQDVTHQHLVPEVKRLTGPDAKLIKIPNRTPQRRQFKPSPDTSQFSRDENMVQQRILEGTSSVNVRGFSTEPFVLMGYDEAMGKDIDDSENYVRYADVAEQLRNAVIENRPRLAKLLGEDGVRGLERNINSLEGSHDKNLPPFSESLNAATSRLARIFIQSPSVAAKQIASSPMAAIDFGWNAFAKAVIARLSGGDRDVLAQINAMPGPKRLRAQIGQVEASATDIGSSRHTRRLQGRALQGQWGSLRGFMTNIARSLGFPIRWMDTKAIDIVHLAAFHKGLEDGMTRDQAIEYAAVEGGIAMNRHQISSNRLHMAGMRQSKNLAVRVASFMSGATSAGYQAITFAVRSRRAALASGDAESIADANARLRRTITALGVQAAMVAGITSLLAKKRGGDDDDDEDREKAAEAYLWSFAEAGTGYLPGSALLAPEALKRIAQLANNSDRVKRYGFRAGRTPISQVVGLYSDLADAGAGMLQAEREGGSKGRQRQDAAEEKLYGAGRRLIDFGAGVNTVKFESMLRSLMGSEEQ